MVFPMPICYVKSCSQKIFAGMLLRIKIGRMKLYFVLLMKFIYFTIYNFSIGILLKSYGYLYFLSFTICIFFYYGSSILLLISILFYQEVVGWQGIISPVIDGVRKEKERLTAAIFFLLLIL